MYFSLVALLIVIKEWEDTESLKWELWIEKLKNELAQNCPIIFPQDKIIEWVIES